MTRLDDGFAELEHTLRRGVFSLCLLRCLAILTLAVGLASVSCGSPTPKPVAQTVQVTPSASVPTIEPSPSPAPELDRSTDIPGTYVAPQGRGHFSGGFAGHRMTPFCDGVSVSVAAGATIAGDVDTPTAGNACYNSNPPSSGRHLNVQRKVDIGGGRLVNIPADWDVYPDDIELPRDSIPHILEHAGVFVGWNCNAGDTACLDAVQKLNGLVNDRIDHNDNRVVMAHDNDLPEGTIGMSSWTRVLDFPASEWSQQKDLAQQFIATNSCRFDPEGFCR